MQLNVAPLVKTAVAVPQSKGVPPSILLSVIENCVGPNVVSPVFETVYVYVTTSPAEENCVGDANFVRSIERAGAGELVNVHDTCSPSRRSMIADRLFTSCEPPFVAVELH